MIRDILSSLFVFLRSGALGQKLKIFVKKNTLFRPLYTIAVQRLIDYKYPLTFNIEPTNACNLKCSMCPRNQSKRKEGFIDFELFKKIIDESKPYGPRHFILHKDGEPLLHPKIADMVSYIKKSNPKNTVYISTNGLFLTREMVIVLMEAGLDQLHISIGAVNEETYLKIRGGSLKQLEDNIIGAITVKKEKNLKKPVITLQIIRMQETLKEIESFIKKWKIYDVRFSVPSFLNWGGIKTDLSLDKQKPVRRYPCHTLWLSPSINWDGMVSICCIDWNEEEVLGNVKERSLAQIWQGEKIKQYRTYHLTKQYSKIPICAYCNYWQETPDFWFFWQYKR
ncbi:MAG: radical SAM protein [Candidatus Omnitrophota bacterium]|nr:radical SAM protein [Candidatus Omnitrophota bacterium]